MQISRIFHYLRFKKLSVLYISIRHMLFSFSRKDHQPQHERKKVPPERYIFRCVHDQIIPYLTVAIRRVPSSLPHNR